MIKQKAFTLVELLIAIAVLLIVIAIGSPSYHQIFAKRDLVASAERLYQFLGLAKSQSIKLNKKVFVHFCQKGTTPEWRMSLSEDAACDCFVENSCLLDGRQQTAILSNGQTVKTASGDITFTGLQASYSPMRFSVNAGSVILSDDYGNKLKVVQSTMRLKICSSGVELSGYKQC